MERYLTEKGSFYSHGATKFLLPLYGLFLLAVVSLLLQSFSIIGSGQNLSENYDPLTMTDLFYMIFILAMVVALGYFLYYLRREQLCGDLAPRLARFAAMSTNETVPMKIIAEILRSKPEDTPGLLQNMIKRKYIMNLEIAEDKSQIRILQFHKIYVFEVYCKNCGAQYTQTSEDDMICQYCSHPTVKVITPK